ncbi:hypothetical protein [Hyphomonas sp.]|uniref:hypothetical protein n=1 Tax=Hyphomonas sp. TaxID=87 RepID=UPI00391BE0CA
MPRARPRPALSLTLSPQRRSELAAYAAEVKRAGEAARKRREGAVKPPGEAAEGRAAAGRRLRSAKRRASLTETLTLRMARLRGKLAEAQREGAWELAVTLNRQIVETRRKLTLAESRAAARADKLARRGRGQTRDRFAQLVKNSDRLSDVHLEIADALRDQVLMAGMAGGTPGARSGQAGDGKGEMRTVLSIVGLVELGEDYWGGLGTPGVGGDWAGGRKRSIRRVCRASDGGAAAAADAVRKARMLARTFAEACRDSAGDHPWAAEVAVRVILLNQDLWGAVQACAAIRKTDGLKIAEIVMAAGLEAVAPKVGVAVE